MTYGDRLTGVSLWAVLRLRLVLLAGETDNEEELKATVEFGRRHPELHGIELLPYHRLGLSKVKSALLNVDTRCHTRILLGMSFGRVICHPWGLFERQFE